MRRNVESCVCLVVGSLFAIVALKSYFGIVYIDPNGGRNPWFFARVSGGYATISWSNGAFPPVVYGADRLSDVRGNPAAYPAFLRIAQAREYIRRKGKGATRSPFKQGDTLGHEKSHRDEVDSLRRCVADTIARQLPRSPITFARDGRSGKLVALKFHVGVIAVLFYAYPGVVMLRVRFRRAHRRKHHLCVQCGYDLAGTVSDRCSECGARV